MLVLPEIMAGVAGTLFTETVKVCGALLLHAFIAITLMSPLFTFAVVVMLLLVEAPVHPFGSVHK